MADVAITVPEDIVQALLLPPDAVAVDLQREPGLGALPLSSGKAAALAGMSRWEWGELLGARKKRCLYDRYDVPIFEIAPPVRSFSPLQSSGVLDASGGESNRCCDDTDETGGVSRLSSYFGLHLGQKSTHCNPTIQRIASGQVDIRTFPQADRDISDKGVAEGLHISKYMVFCKLPVWDTGRSGEVRCDGNRGTF